MLLRPYQQRAVNAVTAAEGSVLLALQVGGGKTVIACELIRLALARGERAVFLVHREELVTQARDRLLQFGISSGVIKAGYLEDRTQRVQVACIPSLVRRSHPPADLAIFDEAHHIMADSWFGVVQAYKDAGAAVVGITATPERLDGRGLGAVFDTLVQPVTTRELIDDGHLIEPTVYAPSTVDLTGVRTLAGEFDSTAAAERMGALTGGITRYWNEHARERPTLCFAVNVAHSRMIAEALADVGARTMHVDANSSRDERQRALDGVRRGALDVVTNTGLFLEGLDCPPLSCLIIARPTQSLGLHRQMIGRVMRPHPSKTDAIVLDHAGNYQRHGLITNEVEWSLGGKKRRPQAAPVRQCLECYAVLPGGTPVCTECGFVFPAAAVQPPDVDNPGELVRVGPPPTTAEKHAEYADLVRTASTHRNKIGWARHAYKSLFGTWPRGVKELERQLYTCPNHQPQRTQYGTVTCPTCLRA